MFKKILNYRRKLKFKHQNYTVVNASSLKLFWWKEKHNFGDALNSEIASKYSSKQVEWVPANFSKEFYMAIGSVLQEANNNTIVWGSGFINAKLEPYRQPREILAVRGPLTRRRLLDLKIKCPEVYGDPALIMPEFYYPSCERQYDLGIVPHFVDKKNNFFKQNFNENIKIIDIEQASCEGFIRDVMSCKKIASSSLHGIIIADAYDIPALRISFSNKILGGNFKFEDYFMSVERKSSPSFVISDGMCASDILNLNFNYSKKIDVRKLMSSNPFV